MSTAEEVAEYERASAPGWGYPVPTAPDIAAAVRSLPPGWFLARTDGLPASTSGFTLTGGVARFWGAAVIPEMRGRGLYRALVWRRLTVASARGATLALVHAEPASSPILRGLGFREFGQRDTYRVPV